MNQTWENKKTLILDPILGPQNCFGGVDLY